MAKPQVDEIISSLTEKEKQALTEAIAPIYFEDSSDYLRGLWEVVQVLIGDKINIDDIDAREWLYALQPQLYQEG